MALTLYAIRADLHDYEIDVGVDEWLEASVIVSALRVLGAEDIELEEIDVEALQRASKDEE